MSLIVPERAAPSTPAAGTVVIYAKADGKLYAKDDAGTEWQLSTSTPVAVSEGGTGSSTPDDARIALDVPSNSEAVLKTLFAAKGDLLGASADNTPVIIPGGTEGQIPVARAAAASGVSWEAPAAAGGNGRKNALINGDFLIWQRGTSFAAIADGAYSADRWQYEKAGAMVHTISQSSDVPTVAQAGRFFNYSLLVDCTTADAAIAASDFCGIQQKIEGYNFVPLAQRSFTISFWVKATKTGTYCVGFYNSGADRSYVGEYTINVTDTWEFKEINITASPSAGTWNYTDGVGLAVIFMLACGTDFQGAAGSWNSATDFATANQVNACDSASNNFRICGVQLEDGDEATDFEVHSYTDELLLAKRYLQVIGTGTSGSEEMGVAGLTYSTSQATIAMPLVPEMRTTPSISVSAVGDFLFTTGNIGSGACTAIAVSGVGSKSVLSVNVTATGTPFSGPNEPVLFRGNGTTNARMHVIAEL
jgi:hypothetical protein